MADYDSSLPVRTEAPGDVDIFISDATTPAQKLKVNADGSIDTNFAPGSEIGITDGTDSLEINADGSINSVVTATDLDIRDLAFATDSVDVSGSTVTATATDLDIRDLVFATDKVDVSGSSVTVSATDLDIRDLSAAQDSVEAHLKDGSGADYTSANPLPVSMSAAIPGDEIVDYNTSAAVAKNASVNHDYTVSAGKEFLGDEAWISGSGKLKAELLVNGSVVWVGFNSTSNPNIRIPTEMILKAQAAEVIRFTITNRDKQPQDVYSTLAGVEV